MHDNDYEDNISIKNSSYCELTALYLMWKSCDADIQGLFHYRRFLTGRDAITIENENLVGPIGRRSSNHAVKEIITEEEINRYLDDHDIILPISNMPFPLTAIEDLQRFVSYEDISKLIHTVDTIYPDYHKSLIEVLSSTNISYCNLFIAKRKFVDDYCTWLFRILEETEKAIPVETYDKNHKRIFGYLAEVLLNVFVRHNQYKRKLCLSEY